jgi:hypothetical protein
LYSSEFDCEDGPIKTTFTFKPNSSYRLVGKLNPVHPIDKHDKIFECDVKIFKGTAEFRQWIKVLATNLKVEGEYEYQVCTELTGQLSSSKSNRKELIIGRGNGWPAQT